jgi:hypothetical protein
MASLQRRQGSLSKNQPMGDIDGLSSQAFEALTDRLLGESTAQKNAGHENDLMSRTLRLCQWMDPAAYRVLVSPWMATRTLSRRRSSALLVVD